VAQVGFVLTYYIAAQMFMPADAIPSVSEHFLLVPIVMVVQAVIPIPGGLGVGEYSLGAMYELVGEQSIDGMFGSLAQRVVTWVLGLAGYLVYLRMKPALPVTAAEAATADADMLDGPEPRGNLDGLPAANPHGAAFTP
jgi:hypothetical protein